MVTINYAILQKEKDCSTIFRYFYIKVKKKGDKDVSHSIS